uniref:MARVEL domain-containing protein n=1 Tax=Sander lucioperca TaxID=283035 RepID=A0A8C9XRS2_SANLU
MSEDHNRTTTMEVDTAFIKSKRGILKVAELVTLFVAFVCFVVAATPKYIAATVLEFLITSLLLLLYMFKVNKKLTFFFWPLIVGDVLQHMQVLTNTIHVHFLKFVSSLFFSSLQDVFNSVFAAVYFIVLSLVALTTYTVTGTLVGGIVGLMSTGLLCVDSYMLFKNITFNNRRSETQDQDNQ